MRAIICSLTTSLLLAVLPPLWAAPADVIWVEAEAFVAPEGGAERIDARTSDYGPMARASASGASFIRFGPRTRLSFAPVEFPQAGEWAVWVRAFPITGRAITVAVGGHDVGSTAPEGTHPGLVWTRIGTVRAPVGGAPQALELRAADGDTNSPYVDVIAFFADPNALPYGRTPEEIVRGKPVTAVHEDFGALTVDDLKTRWSVTPPSGSDAVVEMAPNEDDGALHVHNGSGQAWTLTSRVPLGLQPGRQVVARVRLRKKSLMEGATISLPGVGSFSPQVYKNFQSFEYAWLVPPGAGAMTIPQLIGRGGGDTYVSQFEVFVPDTPVSPFVTGRFLPPPNGYREGRMFQLERYVGDADAFTDDDVDGDSRWTLCRLSREENVPWFANGTALKSDSILADRPSAEAGCPPLHLRVGPLLPGKYSAFLSVPGRAIAFSLNGKDWQRFPGTRAPDLGVVTITDGWFDFWLDDRYVEPTNPGPTYADFIRFMPVADPAYAMQPVTPPPLTRGRADSRDVPLTVANPTPVARTAEPVRSGVPVPQGDLASPQQAALFDAQGRPVPCHIQSTGPWPDGSVKWLLLDFCASVPPNASARYILRYGNKITSAAPALATPLQIERATEQLTINTGSLRIAVRAGQGGSLQFVAPRSATPSLTFTGAEAVGTDDRVWRSVADKDTTVEVEESNPFQAVIRVQGRLLDAQGQGPLRFDARLHCYAGRPEVSLEWAFYATEAEDTVSLRRLALLLNGDWSGAQATFGLQDKSQAVAVQKQPRLLQTGASAYGDRGAFPFRLSDATAELATGERAAGWLQVGGPRPFTVCLEDFWQQFPKALQVTPSALSVDLWPQAEGVPPFVAHAGAGKSHRLGLSFGADASPERLLHPLFAAAEPSWYCASGAFEKLVPRVAGRYDTYEQIVDAGFERLHRERAGYGMENWGDVWQGGYVAGAKTWSNQEWDLVNNWVIPYVRTGDQRYLDFAHEAARHFCDVDSIHYSRNPDLVGATWTHCHTAEVGHQLELINFAHAGWVEGLYNIYHLTGDRRGLPVASGIADWVCRHAPLVDHHGEGGPAYSMAIQRPVGWPLTTLCLAYRETRKPEYLQTARRLVDWEHRYQDPDRGIWEAETGHERPYRGGCVFAYTLCRGLDLFAQLTGETEPLRDVARADKWMIGEMWRHDHGYLYEQVPIYDTNGTRVPFTVAEMAGRATRISGDPVYVTVARYALLQHAAGGKDSWVSAEAASSQWGNGILQQVPRMLYDWEQTGLTLDERVTLTPQPGHLQLLAQGQQTVTLVLRNGSGQALTGLTASCLIRGDWQASVVSCPTTLAAGAEAPVTLRCEPPPRLQQYELQNDRAHLHALVRYRLGDTKGVCWNAVRLDIGPPLEVTGPPALALKPGQKLVLTARATASADPQPVSTARATTDLKGLTVGPVVVAPEAGNTVRLEVPVQAAVDAAPADGNVTVTVHAGRREQTLRVPVGIGKVRVLIIENGETDQWQKPFNVLRAYGGIAPEFLPASRLAELPNTAAGLAARWEVITIGDTGTGAAAFSPAQLQALADFTRAGGGLLMVAGARCYAAGGYDRTPLAPLLPVDLRDGSYVMGQIAVSVTEPKVRLFEGYEPTVPAFGAHQRLTPRPQARVLATFADGTPFLALGQTGPGRVAALGGIWNNASGEAFAAWADYGRLIGRLVRWLGDDLELD